MSRPPLPTTGSVRVVRTVDLKRLHLLLAITILVDFVDLIIGIIRINTP